MLTKFNKLGVETKLRRLGVDTKLRRLGVDTKSIKLAVETKFRRLGVDTKLRRLGAEIKGWMDEASSWGSIKLLIYFSNPAVVDTIVDWREAVDMYSIVPNPIIVEFNWVVK